MAKATWHNAVLAESDRCEIVDGNHYFPPDSVNRAHLRDSDTHSVCPWKGEASYYDVVVGDQVNADAAWYYPDARPEARKFEGYVAFWKGVEVSP